MVLASVVLGGMGNTKGAMVGAALTVFLPELFRSLRHCAIPVFGSILVVMMIVRPEGLFPLRARRYHPPASGCRKYFRRRFPGGALYTAAPSWNAAALLNASGD